jgi:hypothetical protein
MVDQKLQGSETDMDDKTAVGPREKKSLNTLRGTLNTQIRQQLQRVPENAAIKLWNRQNPNFPHH